MKAGVLSAGCPGHGAEVKVAVVKVKDVNEVADLLASSQGEEFVQGCIGVVQAVPTTVIFLHGEEAEGTVLRPFDLELLPFRRQDSTIKRGRAKQPSEFVACIAHHFSIICNYHKPVMSMSQEEHRPPPQGDSPPQKPVLLLPVRATSASRFPPAETSPPSTGKNDLRKQIPSRRIDMHAFFV